jgi:plasmid maintenance system antidote protein VapI
MLNDILKKELKNCGISRYQIAEDTGIDAAILCKFVNGQRGIKADTAEKLLKYFGYSIVKTKKRAKQ